MKNQNVNSFGSGIFPLRDCTFVMRESSVRGSKYTAEQAKRFLLCNGFCEAPLDVVNLLADMVSKCANGERIRVEDEYKAFATDGASMESVRAKLTYYVDKNYDCVRESILEKYGYDINKDFMGNKNFSRKIGLVFSVSEEKE